MLERLKYAFSNHGKHNQQQQKLLYAAKNGNVDRLALYIHSLDMIVQRSILNDGYQEDKTPLHLCAENGFLEAVKVLIDGGGNVESFDALGHSAMYYAASNNYPEVCGFLAKAKSPLYCYITKKEVVIQIESPLHRACEKGFLAVVKILVCAGADLNLRISDHQLLFGDAPIHRAAKEGQLECIKFLVEVGASIDIVNDDFNTPLHIAAYCGHVNVVEFLVMSGSVFLPHIAYRFS